MPKTRDILNALRVAALWLLVVSVFLGPASLGGAMAFAATSRPCGVACPCDEAAHDEHADERVDEHADAHSDGAHPRAGADDADHDEGAPCGDDCPEDCPNCSCCRGVAMAVVPLPVPSSAAPSWLARLLAPPESPAAGACAGVFRPPRALT